MKVHKEFLSENPKYQSRPTSRGKDKVHSNKGTYIYHMYVCVCVYVCMCVDMVHVSTNSH